MPVCGKQSIKQNELAMFLCSFIERVYFGGSHLPVTIEWTSD